MKIEDLDELIVKSERFGVIVDANLLLLFVVGECDPRLIERCSRLSAFTQFDYGIMARFVEYTGRLIASPNLVTEVSNLAGKLGSEVLPSFFSKFADKLKIIDEDYVASLSASADGSFKKLGITDATIITIALARKCVVLTDDLALYHVLWSRGAEALNFNHIRQVAGEFQ